ncbi:hypothetical protein OG407_23015 [Streptomyces sp. NBC_01515]|uniref:hypothetical protein n=1 Tax=Streptomyces sp. NBC_01515 TaxID=2903890 RepID=UPI003870C583
MTHTAVSLTKDARTVQPSPARHTPHTTPRVMPLWQAMAHLFAPADGTVRP